MNIDKIIAEYYNHTEGCSYGSPLGKWYVRFFVSQDSPEALDIHQELDFNKARVKIAQYIMNKRKL